MRTWARRIAITLLAVVLLGYAAICIFMYAAQDRLIFHPTADGERIRSLAQAPGNQPFELDRGDAILRGALILGDADTAAPVLLYFGGNADSVSSKAESFAWLSERGVHLLLVPYRGYDGSTGAPGADALRADALAVFDQLAKHPRVDRERIYAMGYSLGSGVATYLAHERDLAGVILAAPYRRLRAIAEDGYPWLPVSLLLRHDFDSLGLAAQIDEPALILHGDQDTLIPIDHGESLSQVWGGGAKLIALPGQGHNGVPADPRSQRAIREFMD